MKKVIIVLFTFILFSSIVSASAAVNFAADGCPTPQNDGSSFNIKITASDSDGVKQISTRHSLSSWTTLSCDDGIGNFPTSCTKSFPYSASGALMAFSLAAKDSLDNSLQDNTETCSIIVTSAVSDAASPTITNFDVSISPTNPNQIIVYVRATDDVDIQQLTYYESTQQETNSHTCPGSSDTACDYTWTLTKPQGTYFYTGRASDNVHPVVSSSEKSVIILGSQPTFTTTQSYFDSNPAVTGTSKSWTVSASDADGDDLTYSFMGDVPSGMTISSSGSNNLVWSSPDITRTVTIKVNDGHNPDQTQSFSLSVSSCSNGATQSCYSGTSGTEGVGVCSAGVQTCTGGSWGACVGAVTPGSETCGNGLDDDCDGVVDDGCAGTFSCTGTPPSNAQPCSGDDIGLTADTSSVLVGSCSAAKCEYVCSSGFSLSGGNCVASAECGNSVVESGEACDDGSSAACNAQCSGCSSGFSLSNSVCVASAECIATSDCDDNNACTVDSCSDGRCEYSFAAAGAVCGETKKCDAIGQCSVPLDCVDSDGDGYAVGSDLSSCSDYSEPDCNDNDPSIHPGATEICNDNINQNCNEVVDDASLCESAGSCMVDAKRADITSPTSSRFKKNQVVQFAASGAGITSYYWDFGNGDNSYSSSGSTSYSSPSSTITVKLTTVDDNDCTAVKTKTITIFECQSNSDCAQGVCENEKCSIPPNADEPLSVSIASPTSRQYTTKELLLIADTNKPAECSFKLNGANKIPINGQADITAKEGSNSIQVFCSKSTESTQSSVSFTVKTEKDSLLDDLKGDGEGTIKGMFRQDGEEVAQDTQQAADTLTNFLPAMITPSFITTDTDSLVTIQIKNQRLISMNDVVATVTVPKAITEKAALITSTQTFAVIEEDPVIAFGLETLPRQDVKALSFQVPKVLTKEDMDTITVKVQEDANANLLKALATAEATSLKINSEYDKDSDTTTITTTITPKKTLNGYSFIQNIPKCLAEHIDEECRFFSFKKFY